MRGKLYIIFFFTTSLFAQENLLLVEYSEKTDTDYLKETVKCFLTANSDNSYFIPLKAREKGEAIYSEDKTSIIGKVKQINEEIFVDFKKKLLNQHVYYDKTEEYFNLSEQLTQLKWKLTKETKTINNYNCNKATVYFRGRNYIAWYTSQIPIGVGPWKFHGLPGLILEIADESNAFRWEATAVTYPFRDKIEIPKPNTTNYKGMTLRRFREYLNEVLQKEAALIQSRLPKELSGVTVSSVMDSGGREFIYEWEADYPKDK